MNLPTQSTSKDKKKKKKICYENKPQGQKKRTRKRPSGDALFLLTHPEWESVFKEAYLKKHSDELLFRLWMADCKAPVEAERKKK